MMSCCRIARHVLDNPGFLAAQLADLVSIAFGAGVYVARLAYCCLQIGLGRIAGQIGAGDVYRQSGVFGIYCY